MQKCPNDTPLQLALALQFAIDNKFPTLETSICKVKFDPTIANWLIHLDYTEESLLDFIEQHRATLELSDPMPIKRPCHMSLASTYGHRDE